MKKGTASLVLVMLIFVGIKAAQADAPVWKVVKGKNQLFIGGTLHLLSKSDYPLPDAFESAYRQSAMVVFEADMEKMQSPEFQQLLQLGFVRVVDMRGQHRGLRQIHEQHRVSDDVKIGLEILPHHAADAGHRRVQRLAARGQGQLVAEFEFEPLRHALLD